MISNGPDPLEPPERKQYQPQQEQLRQCGVEDCPNAAYQHIRAGDGDLNTHHAALPGL